MAALAGAAIFIYNGNIAMTKTQSTRTPAQGKEEKARELMAALSRRVGAVYPSEEAFLSRLQSGRPLKLYLGIDPTNPHLHFGHAVPLLILRDLQKFGHKAVILIGDFTGRIGDPTGKSATRVQLTAKDVQANMKTFRAQIGKIISFTGENAALFERNTKWLSKMTFEDVVRLSSRVTVQQMIERDMFQERIKAGKPIGLHEFLYPLMQGYDSVAMDVDGEVGGTDQMFNMMMGRQLMRDLKGKDKFVLTTQLLVDPITGKKVSKTEGGLIQLDDSATDIFGKTMAMPDSGMFSFARLSTDMPLRQIESLQEAMMGGQMNPRDAKLDIAVAAVSLIYGEKVAQKEKEKFLSVFSQREKPESAAVALKVSHKEMPIVDLVVASGAAKSKSDAWRLIEQGACDFAGETIRDPRKEVSATKGSILRVGKHAFFKIS